MNGWKVGPLNRRGLLLLAAAAGVSLAMPRLVVAAANKADRGFGGDLTAVRASIETQRPRPSSACRTGSHCLRLRLRTAI